MCSGQLNRWNVTSNGKIVDRICVRFYVMPLRVSSVSTFVSWYAIYWRGMRITIMHFLSFALLYELCSNFAKKFGILPLKFIQALSHAHHSVLVLSNWSGNEHQVKENWTDWHDLTWSKYYYILPAYWRVVRGYNTAIFAQRHIRKFWCHPH